MATTKAAKEMVLMAKYTIKRNGAVIHRMRSNQPNKKGFVEGRDQVERNGQWFDVYMVSSDGETVCGCQCGDEQCRGSKYRGTCCHRKHAQMLLDTSKSDEQTSPLRQWVDGKITTQELVKKTALLR